MRKQRRQFLRTCMLGSALGLSSYRTAAMAPDTISRAPFPRLAVLDWGLVETLLALGVTPAGVAETRAYNDSVVTPRLPSQATDLGLRLEPSLELLQQLAPDLILINSSQESQRAMLARIAPVHAFAIYTDAGSPYRHAQDATLAVGRLCQREAAARQLLASTAQGLEQVRTRIGANRVAASSNSPRPLYLVRFFDGRHIGIYGKRSLFQDVMNLLELKNAWDGSTDYWGIGVAGLEKLAANPEASVLYFDPLPSGVAATLASSRLWQALPAVTAGRVAALPPFWGFGMLPSALRFALALEAVLDSGTLKGTMGVR